MNSRVLSSNVASRLPEGMHNTFAESLNKIIQILRRRNNSTANSNYFVRRLWVECVQLQSAANGPDPVRRVQREGEDGRPIQDRNQQRNAEFVQGHHEGVHTAVEVGPNFYDCVGSFSTR